ncbi:MAG: MaoC/PaaZ C-terminal domain-containing protein [Halioglobus sp.]
MNEQPRTVELTAIPAMPRMLLAAATTRKKSHTEPVFKPLVIRARGIRAEAAKLAKFSRVCGFDEGNALPLTYPHIMAFPLHMQLMLAPEFPFTPMGAVHVRNDIQQQRSLRADESLDFEVRLGSTEQVEKGYEVGIITEVSAGGVLVWQDLSVMLIRKHGSGVKSPAKVRSEGKEFDETLQWHLDANLGRQYAAASGDYNPIHLYSLTAKLMGFQRQIVHGMWSKSRCVAHLLPAGFEGAASVNVAFKLPVFLPGSVTLVYNRKEGDAVFELRDSSGVKPHLAGELTWSA